MQTKPQPAADAVPYNSIVTERNRYFTGKYMTARDFLAEQAYFLSRHRLHSRLLHGWGVVCGLEVTNHPDPACRKEWIVIKPGIALDSYGRELIVGSSLPVELPEPPESTSAGAKSAGGETDDQDQPPREPLLVCLRYIEKPIEYVPALYAEGGVDPTHQEPNRVRETVCVEFKRLNEVDDDCWLSTGGGESVRCRDDCDEPQPGPGGTCLDPEDPCCGTVPLALISFDDPQDTETCFDIEDALGRRNLRGAAYLLTNIVAINWPHGERISLEELREQLWDGECEGYRLKVTFDRKLLVSPYDLEYEKPSSERDLDADTKSGVNRHTFVVEYAGAQLDREFVRFDPEAGEGPKVNINNQYEAVFDLPEQLLRPGRDSLANSTIYIMLKCDFIMDCHGTPVDGNHLRGRLPSGNGTPGGMFESWFYVTSD